jgi:hypothetical protein
MPTRDVVAEFQAILSHEKAYVLCFSFDTGEWVNKDVMYLVLSQPWWPAGVLSHYG